jgi:hypothetical protein
MVAYFRNESLLQNACVGNTTVDQDIRGFTCPHANVSLFRLCSHLVPLIPANYRHDHRAAGKTETAATADAEAVREPFRHIARLVSNVSPQETTTILQFDYITPSPHAHSPAFLYANTRPTTGISQECADKTNLLKCVLLLYVDLQPVLVSDRD